MKTKELNEQNTKKGTESSHNKNKTNLIVQGDFSLKQIYGNIGLINRLKFAFVILINKDVILKKYNFELKFKDDGETQKK